MTQLSSTKAATPKWIATAVFMASTLAAPMASATSAVTPGYATSAPVVPLPKARLLADNVVVTPGNAAPAPAAPAAPAPSQTVVVPQQSAPAAAQPAAEPQTRKNVSAEVSGSKNYMGTIALSALMGGLTGALIGGAIYYLGDQQEPRNIAYWAAGGVLLGTGVGVVQVAVQESRVSNATASRYQSDPAPTFRLALFRTQF